MQRFLAALLALVASFGHPLDTPPLENRGSLVSNITTNFSAPRGVSGFIKGLKGTSADVGPTGSSGETGPSGTTGEAGPTGATGTIGISGQIGATVPVVDRFPAVNLRSGILMPHDLP